MATTTFCDWCGELIDSRRPLELRAAGYIDDGDENHFVLHHVLAGGFNVHAEYLVWGEVDPDCCLGKLEALLRERAAWAHDPEQEGTEWRLVPREGRKPTAREQRRTRLQEIDEAYGRWRAFPSEKRAAVVLELLGQEPATINELVERMEQALPDMGGFYDGSVRPIVSKMFKAGTLDREGEKWRAGDGPGSIRYRYFIPTEQEA